MGIIDKKTGEVKPFREWPKVKLRGPRKPADSTLKDFHTKIPGKTLSKFNQAIEENGDKIQTVIKNLMEGYSDKILNREGDVK